MSQHIASNGSGVQAVQISNPSGPTVARHVALIVETSNAYARGLLRGIKNYMTVNPGWSIYWGEHGRQDTDLSWLNGWRGDGVIARIENEAIATRVRQLWLPTVDLSAFGVIPEMTGVETDDNEIIRMALAHLVDRGFRTFAFCGDPRFQWSTNRAAFFREAAQELGATPHEYELRSIGDLARNRSDLADWVRGLPKPVGVLGCYDGAAQEVLEACRVGGLIVPDEVGVIGVDNDELICSLASPPMTSVQTDAIGTGYLAADLLERFMSGERLAAGMHRVPPLRVVARRSTDAVSVTDPVVARALRFIRARVDLGVKVHEVEHEVGLSRRSLDYRFVNVVGRTVHEDIVRVRMDRVAHLLIDTDWSLAEIAQRMSFTHGEYMGVMFKQHTGMSPGSFRARNRGGTA